MKIVDMYNYTGSIVTSNDIDYLIIGFYRFLEYMDKKSLIEILEKYSINNKDYIKNLPSNVKDMLFDDLVYCLDSISPVGYYFGTNKNNINDYGYWQL
jgi:hypothetical protein